MRQMMQNNAHTAATANAGAMFSCAYIALLADTMIPVSAFVILIALLGLIRLNIALVIISILVLAAPTLQKT